MELFGTLFVYLGQLLAVSGQERRNSFRLTQERVVWRIWDTDEESYATDVELRLTWLAIPTVQFWSLTLCEVYAILSDPLLECGKAW